MNTDLIIAAISALIGAFVGYFTHRGVTSQERTRKQQYFSELRHWADEAVYTLSHVVHLSEIDPSLCKEPSFFNRQHKLKIDISSIVDRGRWFFPNLEHTKYGDWKPDAYQGFRHPAIDTLVYAYKAVHNMDDSNGEKNKQLREPLNEIKKEFVSEIQRLLDPRKAQEEFGQAKRQEQRNE